MFTSSSQPDSTSQLSRAFNRILFPALLLSGSIVPQASAKCFLNLASSPATPHATTAAVPSSHAAVQSAAPATVPVSIVGMWKVSFTFGGQVFDEAFEVWHSDGTEILNDYTDPVEGNVCLGVWRQTGPRTYKLKHPAWLFDATGTLIGSAVMHATVQLSEEGNSYQGSYTYDIYDVSGAFVEELAAQLNANRIKPD